MPHQQQPGAAAEPFIEKQRLHLTKLRAALVAAAQRDEAEEATIKSESGGAQEYEDDAQRLAMLELDGNIFVRNVRRGVCPVLGRFPRAFCCCARRKPAAPWAVKVSAGLLIGFRACSHRRLIVRRRARMSDIKPRWSCRRPSPDKHKRSARAAGSFELTKLIGGCLMTKTECDLLQRLGPNTARAASLS